MARNSYGGEDAGPAHGVHLTNEFWLAQLEVRLSRIEFMIARLETNILLVCAGLCTVIGFEVLACFRSI